MNTNNSFINAVFNIDVDEFERLLDTAPFDRELLTDIHFTDGDPCPIQWITQCWEVILEKPEDWNESCRGIIARRKEKNQRIKRIFEEKFDVVFKPIDFYNTDFWFFRNERDDTYEDCFGFTKQEMLDKGYRDIDLELYLAVCKFDFNAVERLLKLGADPACEIKEEDSFCLDRIGGECSFLEMELKELIFGYSKSYPTEREGDVADLIGILGLCAHQMMYNLLEPYDTRTEK